MKYLILILLTLVGNQAIAEDKNFFDLSPVKFFDSKKVLDTEPPQNSQASKEPLIPQQEEPNNLWSEPMIGPDGKVSVYTPPTEVKTFLDNPTEESGKAYLEWSIKRINKLKKAETILKKLSQDLLNNKFEYSETYSQKLNLDNVNYIAFFLLKGCPYCAEQIKNILILKKQRPELKIEVFVKNYDSIEIKKLPFTAKDDNDLSSYLGFNKFPTTLFADKEGNRELIGGVLGADVINKLITSSEKL